MVQFGFWSRASCVRVYKAEAWTSTNTVQIPHQFENGIFWRNDGKEKRNIMEKGIVKIERVLLYGDLQYNPG